MDDPSPEFDEATAAIGSGRYEVAIDRTSALLARAPGHPGGHALLARIALGLQQPDMALAPARHAMALDPDTANRLLCVQVLLALGRAEEAGRVLDPTLGLLRDADGHHAAALALETLGRTDPALDHLAQAVRLEPRHAAAWQACGRLLRAACRMEEAVQALRRAVLLAPGQAIPRRDLAASLAEIGRFQEALSLAQEAVRLAPDDATTHWGLGTILLDLNRSEEAVQAYTQAVRLAPTLLAPRLGRALALLKSGNWERGWREYECRWGADTCPRPDLSVPFWRGEALEGRTILLHAEQGLGDVLQFVRFAPVVAARGGRVVLEVPATLAGLLRGMAGIAAIVESGSPLPPVDLHCPLCSLPFALSVRPGTVPSAPYLPVRWRPRGDKDGTLVVGLAWAGGSLLGRDTGRLADARRSISPACLSGLAGLEGVRFVSLQYGADEAERRRTGLDPQDRLAGVADYAGTASRLHGLDLLISVDTSIAHLAGAMGMPVWMLSRFDGCWRWLEGRSDTVWYPTMRIFRQDVPGDWEGAIRQVRRALLAHAAASPRRADQRVIP